MRLLKKVCWKALQRLLRTTQIKLNFILITAVLIWTMIMTCIWNTKVEPTTVAKTESATEKSTASAVTEKTTQSTYKSASLISTDTAKTKALADANVSADKATFIKDEKDYDNEKVIFDTEQEVRI